MKNLIVTADDFGVFPSINLAIKESVIAGKVNSVAAIANYIDSVKNVKEFINEVGNKADIGCHLTISSGKPLTIKDNEAFTKGSYFRPFSGLRIDAIEKQNKILEKELRAQVEVFLDSGIKVTHLSCHHSILTATKGLFKVYLDVTEHFKLPMRSVNVVPKKADMAFRNYLQFLLFNRVSISKLLEIRSFGNEINSFLKINKPHIKTPAILESGHYGPWLDIWDIGLKGRIKRKHNHLNGFLHDFIEKEYCDAELMLHLSKTESDLKKLDNEIDYPGISKSYFKNRNAEFYSINTFNFSPFLGKIRFGDWKTL